MALSPTIARLVEIEDGLPISRDVVSAVDFFVARGKPGIVLLGRPEGELERLLASFRVMQPSIQSLIAIASEPIGVLPPVPTAAEAAAAWNLHPASRILNCTRLLSMDAARCWHEGDYNGAADRLTATLRWSHELLQPDAEGWVLSRGYLCLWHTLVRLDAQTAAGLATHLDASRRARLLEALTAFDGADPTRHTATFERLARTALVWMRERFSGPDAGEKLAAYIESKGVEAEELGSSDVPTESYIGGVVVRRDLDNVRSMSAAAIAGHLDAAEAMIGPVAAAMRSPDALVALKPLQAQAAADPSQVARVVLGAPAAAAYNSGIVAKLLSDCRERLAKEMK